MSPDKKHADSEATDKQLCMFCGTAIRKEDLTREHFVPRCLWLRGHMPNGVKVLPAHKICNQNFSQDNEYFRDVMVMQESALRHPEAKRVYDGPIRRKWRHRPGAMRKNLKSFRIRPVFTPSGIYVGHRPLYEVDVSRLKRVLFNVMKGVFYVTQKQPLPQEFLTYVKDLRCGDCENELKLINHMVPPQSFGDSTFWCRYVVSQKTPVEKIACLMVFYNCVYFFCESISPKLLVRNVGNFVPATELSSILVPVAVANKMRQSKIHLG